MLWRRIHEKGMCSCNSELFSLFSFLFFILSVFFLLSFSLIPQHFLMWKRERERPVAAEREEHVCFAFKFNTLSVTAQPYNMCWSWRAAFSKPSLTITLIPLVSAQQLFTLQCIYFFLNKWTKKVSQNDSITTLFWKVFLCDRSTQQVMCNYSRQ